MTSVYFRVSSIADKAHLQILIFFCVCAGTNIVIKKLCSENFYVD